MNIRELQEALDAAGVDRAAYDLQGGQPNEKYTIERGVGGWFVYYSERGKRTDEAFFGSEDAATQYLFDWIMRDPSTRAKKN